MDLRKIGCTQNNIYMEEIHNLVTGCLVPKYIEEGEDSEEEGGDDDIGWVGYKDVGDLGRGKSLVTFEKPKRIKGELIDLQTGRARGVAGGFHITDPWWQVTILRTKKNKEKLLEPKDYFALCYRLRNDERRFSDRVVHLFLSKLQDTLTEVDKEDGTKIKIAGWFSPARIQFDRFLKERGLYDDLDILNLEEHLEAFVDSFPEDEQTESSTPFRFKQAILLSAEFHLVKVGETYPELMHYIPQLFPGTFKRITSLETDKLEKLKALVTEEPGLLAFKPIVSKECGILGCETSYEALRKSGLLTKVPQNVRDAILMYEYIKKDTKENGHTYIHFSRILDVLGPVIELFEEALEFLNKNKVTKTFVESGDRNVFLTTLWKAENNIACGINSLVKLDEKQPWQLHVDWDSEGFDSIRQDNDQLRAAKLIASKPVLAISGKGGCGKTYVVTKVITSVKASRGRQTDEGNDETENGDGDTGAAWDGDKGDDSYELLGDYPEDKEKCPEKIELLLTAPTGKAANLLGKRARKPSFTLHQVIYSYRNQNKDNPWKHKDVNTLVVDECSLVSVSTFSFLIQLLQEQAKLRRVILLGDVRQLPSIEPGNFLSDTFASLDRIGCAVELQNNHRAESARIVDNATRISKKMYPEFHPEQFSLLKLPPNNPSTRGDDYTAQDISMKVMELLKHDALKDHATSQFISFTRRVCDSINDLCCKNYSDHRTKEHGKFAFRTGDKICCTKNGYVNLYQNHHGVMTCQSQPSQDDAKEEESEGGVERTVNYEEDTSLFENPGDQSTLNGSLNTAAGSSKQKQSGKSNQIRLCNGEIFFILDELETKDDGGKTRTFLQLTDRDPDKDFTFWVDKGQLRKACKIRHAWARTIHTFQGSETDSVVYIVGSGSWRQNWQHVYTAVTRGRKSVFIIGREDILRNAIKRSEIKRQTSLRKQLLEKLQKNKDFNTTEMMQMSAMNSTTFQPASTTTKPVKQKHKAGNSAVVSGSHGQLRQPVITEFTTAAGSTSLNSTKLMTDVLSSLASEHDDDMEKSDMEEYDSDDSQSLFTKIKPAKDKMESKKTYNNTQPVAMETIQNQNKPMNHLSQSYECNVISNIGKEGRSQELPECDNNAKGVDKEDMDNIRVESDPESDDSQSLISPPTTRARARAKAERQCVPTNTSKCQASKCDKDIHSTNNLRKTSESNEHVVVENKGLTAMKGRNNHSKLRLSKGKMPLSFVRNQSAETPVNVSVSRRYRYSIQDINSPITPLMNRSKFSPNLGGMQNTSSPVTDVFSEFQGHPRSGVSPLTMCPAESLTESKSVLSGAKVFDSSYRSVSPSNSSFVKDRGNLLRDLVDIKQPNSNESVQWSEIDETDYLKLVDESNIQMEDLENLSDPNDQQNRVLSKQPSNMSVNTSQWSEVDDDQYMTLDLEDIDNMTFGNHGNKDIEETNAEENQSLISDFKNNQDINKTYGRHISERSLPSDKHRNKYEIHIPDSPLGLETQTFQPMSSKSPSRKRSMEGNDTHDMSPLKHSLSKLKFK